MQPFTYTKAKTNKEAIAAISANSNAKFIGGGTNLVDLMKMNIETPQQLIDITSLDLKKLKHCQTEMCALVHLVPNSDLAYDKTIMSKYPLLVKSFAVRRFSAIKKHGNNRRQYFAANTMLLFL